MWSTIYMILILQGNESEVISIIDGGKIGEVNAQNVTLHYRFGFLFTSSSLHACSIILLGWLGVIPEWPFDQSYDMA